MWLSALSAVAKTNKKLLFGSGDGEDDAEGDASVRAKKKLAKLQRHADGVEINSFEVFSNALEEVCNMTEKICIII